MIKVTRLNDSVLMINVEKIQSVQSTPDTLITFTNHDRMMVKEALEEISERIVAYQRAVNAESAGRSATGTRTPGALPGGPPPSSAKELQVHR
jgi:flagellar protein FlbD